MNILISCHCKEKHAILDVKRHSVEIDNVHYIDTGCPRSEDQFTIWSEIPSDMYDIIWTVNCPFYIFLKLPKDVFKDNSFNNMLSLDIFEHGWRVLKSRGSLVIPIKDVMYEKSLPEILVQAQQFVEYKLKKPWNVSLVKIQDMSVSIPYQNKHYALLFEKSVSGGNRTRRSKRKSRKLKHRTSPI